MGSKFLQAVTSSPIRVSGAGCLCLTALDVPLAVCPLFPLHFSCVRACVRSSGQTPIARGNQRIKWALRRGRATGDDDNCYVFDIQRESGEGAIAGSGNGQILVLEVGRRGRRRGHESIE